MFRHRFTVAISVLFSSSVFAESDYALKQEPQSELLDEPLIVVEDFADSAGGYEINRSVIRAGQPISIVVGGKNYEFQNREMIEVERTLTWLGESDSGGELAVTTDAGAVLISVRLANESETYLIRGGGSIQYSAAKDAFSTSPPRVLRSDHDRNIAYSRLTGERREIKVSNGYVVRLVAEHLGIVKNDKLVLSEDVLRIYGLSSVTLEAEPQPPGSFYEEHGKVQTRHFRQLISGIPFAGTISVDIWKDGRTVYRIRGSLVKPSSVRHLSSTDITPERAQDLFLAEYAQKTGTRPATVRYSQSPKLVYKFIRGEPVLGWEISALIDSEVYSAFIDPDGLILGFGRPVR